MKDKKKLLLGFLPVAALAVVAVSSVTSSGKLLTKAQYTNPTAGTWVHYAQKAPTVSQDGIREYWVSCSTHEHQFTAPAEGDVVDYNVYDTSEFGVDDDRLFKYRYDEDHLALSEYQYGGGMYLVSASEYKNSRATFGENNMNFNLYSDDGNKLVWRIDLPRIDYTRYPTVTMDVMAPNWYEGNMMGPEADQLTYHTNFGGNKDQGKIRLTLGSSGLHMEFNSLEYASTLAFERTFTDSDIITGVKSAYFYTEDLYDRYLNIENIVLSSTSTPTSIYSYNKDKTKLSVTNGDIKYISESSYEISNAGLATEETCLVIDGNANPGAMVVTLPAINFGSYTNFGAVSFKFGVRNNNEPMFFGSGDSKISLGSNSGNSQTDLSGYVNWEMIIVDGVAYVHNVFENQNYIVPLTAGMRAGTESIVISGGNTSIYRRYLVTDFYWQLTPDYPLVAPSTPADIYSYAGNTSAISVINGTVGLPSSVDQSIINNGYGDNSNSLVIDGNANPGAAVITLPAVNLNPFTADGKVTIKFGVRNNGEKMYFGSGEGRVDLGSNSPTSQSENNNGYVNWELVITDDGAYVNNAYTDQDYNVTLTAGMRAGTESIVISGGDTSIYRRYLVTDFYWSALL